MEFRAEDSNMFIGSGNKKYGNGGINVKAIFGEINAVRYKKQKRFAERFNKN